MTITKGQKRTIGAIIIFFVAPFLLLLAVVLVEHIAGSETVELSTVYSFLFTIGLCTFPLQFGIKLWRAGSRRIDSTQEVPAGTEINVTVKITQQEYVRLLFSITYQRPTILYITFIAIGMIGFYFFQSDMTFFILFFCLLGAYLPFGIYRNAVSSYKSTKALHETVSYEFTTAGINVNGESFKSSMRWSTLHDVKEMKRWFLFYTTKTTALIVPKNVLHSEEEIELLRNLAFSKVESRLF